MTRARKREKTKRTRSISRNAVLPRTHSGQKTASFQMKTFLTAAAIFIAISLTARADLDTAKIDQLTGLKGKMNQAEGVYKGTFPRDDVKVSVAGCATAPFIWVWST